MIRRRAQSSQFRTLVESAYPDPNPFDTAEQLVRFHHDDIRDLRDEDLDDERLLARLRRAVTPEPSAWLVERLGRLEREAGRRRAQQQGRQRAR